jgi:hypothetical protein
MEVAQRYAEQADAKRAVAAELRRIAKSIPEKADRVTLVSHASTLEAEAAALDEEAGQQRVLLRA